jgi:hypothetical protein
LNFLVSTATYFFTALTKRRIFAADNKTDGALNVDKIADKFESFISGSELIARQHLPVSFRRS